MSKTQINAAPGIPLIITTREFDAPGELVFRAHIEPELLVQWLGPRDLTLAVDRWEARDGGTWRYVHTDARGNNYGFHGVFDGDPSPQAIVQTFEFEGAPGHVALQAALPGRRARRGTGAGGRWPAGRRRLLPAAAHSAAAALLGSMPRIHPRRPR
ncbi:MAG: SRPBCC domain-containing protein [Streptosporangiaceae bacterium]|jgi:uncharacterized protein YndB with AHSA1/START domain